MKRERGAPPGNQNAFKHGFYSSLFQEQEHDVLDQLSSVDVEGEIDLLRVATARLLETLQDDEKPRDLQTELSILRAIVLGTMSINGLVRTRLMVHGGWRRLKGRLAPSPSTTSTGPGDPSGNP